jgi:hypothetical protein
MNENDIEPKPLPTFITVLVGLILLPICLLSIIGSIYIIFIPEANYPEINLVAGTLLTLLSIWATFIGIKLLFNLKGTNSGLFNPLSLRIIGTVTFLIPIIAMVIGTFWEKPLRHTIMTIAYWLAAFGLWRLAAFREKLNSSDKRN